MVLNKLGIITDEVSENFTEALDWISKNNLKHVELRIVFGENIAYLGDGKIKVIHEELSKRDLFVSVIASPLFKCALDRSREVASGDTFGQKEESVEDHFEKLYRVIEIAKMVNTNKIRIFSFWRECEPKQYFQEIVRHLTKAAKIAEKENMILLLENESSCNGGYAHEVAAIVKAVQSAHLKALWDPGNEEYAGGNAYPNGYEAIKDHVAHVHLKDAIYDKNQYGTCVPIGTGDVAFTEQLAALQNDGYTGLYTIETHYIPENGTPMDGTEQSLDGLRKLLSEISKIK